MYFDVSLVGYDLQVVLFAIAIWYPRKWFEARGISCSLGEIICSSESSADKNCS